MLAGEARLGDVILESRNERGDDLEAALWDGGEVSVDSTWTPSGVRSDFGLDNPPGQGGLPELRRSVAIHMSGYICSRLGYPSSFDDQPKYP